MIKTALSNPDKKLYAFINETRHHEYGITIIAPDDVNDDAYMVIPDYNHAVSIAQRLIK